MRIMIERALVQKICTEEKQEMIVLKGKLKVADKTINGLKDMADKHGQEVKMLQNKLLVSEVQLSEANT